MYFPKINNKCIKKSVKNISLQDLSKTYLINYTISLY